MTRTVLGSLCAGLLLVAGAAAIAAGPAAVADQSADEIKLGECAVYFHAPSGTMIAIRGEQHYFGTATAAVPFARGDQTHETDQGLVIKFTSATSNNKSGVLMYCSNSYYFYAAADESTWSHFASGKDTVVPVSTKPTELVLPCGVKLGAATGTAAAPPAATRPSANGTKPPADSKVVPAASETRFAAAPTVKLIEGERVKPAEAMVFTRSVLLEEGGAVSNMMRHQENIDTVRYNMNSYRLGYALPAEQVGERWIFSGPVKGWRATSTGDISAWPATKYRQTRVEAMRRAKLLEPILLAEPIDEMNNLRVYYFPSLSGHNGSTYVAQPAALAFFIHPKTGYRMTVMLRNGRTYGAVNKPLSTTSYIYIQDATPEEAGPAGLATAWIPNIFYTKRVRYDVEPFPEGETFDRLLAAVLEAHKNAPLATADFTALHNEMARYTGGTQ